MYENIRVPPLCLDHLAYNSAYMYPEPWKSSAMGIVFISYICIFTLNAFIIYHGLDMDRHCHCIVVKTFLTDICPHFFQINAQTELALRYNDISPLENHHCSVAFEILERKNCNIFRNLTKDQFKRVREGMIK